MFDLNATDGSVRVQRYKSPIPSDESGDGRFKPSGASSLDGDKMVRLHKKLMGYYKNELSRQSDNRLEMAEDEDYYDNIQWDKQEAATLRERGQQPLVYNVISASIDWVTGTQKRTRTDFRILPRKKDDATAAQRKTDLMKYLSDVNRTNFDISRAFEDSVKVGIGWMEDGVDFDSDAEPIYTRYESWRNILWDSTATSLDLSDARYLFRTKWLDEDVAAALFPKRKELIRRSCDRHHDGLAGTSALGDEPMDMPEEDNNNSFIVNETEAGQWRNRVRVIEAWFRLPVEAKRLKGGAFHGELFDEMSAGHQATLDAQEAQLNMSATMVTHVAIFTQAGMLWFSKSPYRHNRFPLTPVWGYRRGRDGQPYGMIRRLKDIQQDVNKRASKALHILSSNKVIMDEGAVDMRDGELLEEISRPDAVIVTRANSRFEIRADRDLAPAHLELMSRDISIIQQSSGVTDELLGRKTNATSGIAIQSRQEQGSMATAKLFDNLMLFSQIRGEKQLSLLEQFMSQPKQFRITNQRGQPEYIDINELPENDITRSKADFLISESDWQVTLRQAAAGQVTLRQAAAGQLMELATKLPQEVSLMLLDLVVDNMDLPNREEIVKRIRSVTGQRDPDSDGTNPTPEEIEQAQRQAAQEQAAAQAQALQMATLEAAAMKAQAEADKAAALAEKARADMARVNVGTQKEAIETAGMAITAPQTVDMADAIMHESGFVSRSEKEQQQAAQQQAAQQQAVQASQMEQKAPNQPAENKEMNNG